MRRRIVPELLRVGRKLRASLFRPSVEREVAEELEFHVAMRTRELMERGVDEDEARRRAEALFKDMDEVRRRCERIATRREGMRMWKGRWDEVRQDLVFTLRQLRRRPAFAAVAVLTLALGIGANTAVFSVVHGVLLRPLPWEEPGELVSLWTRYLPSTGVDIPQFTLSPPELLDYRETTEAMSDVAAYMARTVTLDDGIGEPERVRTLAVDAHLTSVLRLRPALGRDLSAEEHAPGAAPSVLLSDGYWRRRFGGDPDAVGSTVELDGRTARVVGVLPEGRTFPSPSVDLWTPLGLDEADPGSRGGHWLMAVGRLAPGETLAAAEAELETITAAWYEEWEHHAAGHFIFLRPLQEDLIGEIRPVLLTLMGAVVLVLIIACGNVASLFLVRREARQGELAVRAALGAGRRGIARLLLLEAGVVAALGAGLGGLLAWWGTPALLAMAPDVVPRSEAVRLGLPVLAFTASVAVLATLALGLSPVPSAADGPVPGRLASDRHSAGRGAGRARRWLVAGQLALCVVVVLGAGLVVRSFRTLAAVEPGVRTGSILTFGLTLPAERYTGPEQVTGTWERLVERVEALPGVAEAGAVGDLPLTGSSWRSDFLVEGEDPGGDGVPKWNAEVRPVLPGYFESVGIPVLEGRPPTPADGPAEVLRVWVDRALVDRYWPGQSVLGRRVSLGSDEEGAPIWLTVTGVVASVRETLQEEPAPHAYLAQPQLAPMRMGVGRGMTFTLRTEVPPAAVVPGVRTAVGDIAPGLPLEDVRTMEEVLERSLGPDRLAASLMGAFALLALLLAVLGIYGVVSYSVTRRTREVGIRTALGAGRGAVVRLMLAEGALPALAGVAAGLGAALLLAPLLTDLLFGVRPRDPGTFALVATGLVGVALVSAWIPARRAAGVPPAEALRTE